MLMDEKINLLVLDEPTNHLDIGIARVGRRRAGGLRGRAASFVSHDRYFVDKFATRIWELENGTIRDFPCGYEKYRSIKAFEAMQAVAPTKAKAREEGKAEADRRQQGD